MSPTSSEKGSIITPLIVIVNWNSGVIWITTNNVNFSAKRHCWIIVNTKNEFKIERYNLYLINIVYLLRIRVSGTTTPWISWNCKNFCFRWCYSTSCERLASVISQAKDTFMRIGSRLWWREIGSVKSEKIVELCCLTKFSSHLWQVLSYPYEKQRSTNSSLFETNVLHAAKYISKPMSPIIFIEQFSILLNYFFHFYGLLREG